VLAVQEYMQNTTNLPGSWTPNHTVTVNQRAHAALFGQQVQLVLVLSEAKQRLLLLNMECFSI
jgi:hypothetical protein